MTAFANPFSIEALPAQARFYKQAFRSGTRGSGRVSRLVNRIGFYAWETFGTQPRYGRFSYGVGDDRRSIRFDARNRQFSAIYFDAFQPIYEPDVAAAILQFAPTDGVFFDVGSNWGYFSLLLAARPGFKGRIHAFEPWPTTYADLDSVVSQASLADVITTHRLALGASEGQVSMRCGRHSGLAQITEAASAEQLQTVQQVTLDGLDLPAPDLMKLDVEGAEAAILEGGRELVRRSRPIIVFEHTPGEDLAQAPGVASLLVGLDYDLYQPLPTLRSAAPHYIALNPLDLPDVGRFAQRLNLVACPTERRASLADFVTTP